MFLSSWFLHFFFLAVFFPVLAGGADERNEGSEGLKEGVAIHRPANHGV